MNARIFILLRNHIRIVKNWLSLWENLFFFIFVLIFLVGFLIFLKQRLLQNEDDFSLQVLAGLLVLFMPIFLTRLYLKMSQKENQLLLTSMSGRELIKLRRNQAILVTLLVFFVLLILGFFPEFRKIPKIVSTSGTILFLFLISFLLAFPVESKQQKSKNIKKRRLLSLGPSYHEASPVRAVIIRDLMSLWRQKRKQVFGYLLALMIINAVCFVISIKNNLENFYIWSFLVQIITLMDVVLNSAIENDMKLLKMNGSYAYDIFKGKIIFWLALCILYLLLIIPVHYILLPAFSNLFLVMLCPLLVFILAYTLLIRLAYCENNIMRNLIMIFTVVIPIAIPFFIYNCCRRLRC